VVDQNAITRAVSRIPIVLLPLFLAAGWAGEVVERIPRWRESTVMVAAGPAEDWGYLAFPALLDRGTELLVSFKRARSHAQDPGAALDLLRLDPATGRASGRATLARIEGQIMQMGEWVRFANGDLANYIDAQLPGKVTTRAGLRVVRSGDGGRTFGPPERVGPVDGVEYGYAFDHITEGGTTWMLAMTFANLPGGQPAPNARPPAGSVDVLRTEDHGRTWRFVRNLSREFGDVPINESAFHRHGAGFLVTTRGYDNRQRLHLTDGDFRVVRQTDLTAAHGAFITSHVGRPRLFARGEGVYLLGRNTREKGRPMQLALFRLDVAALRVASFAVLDNAEHARVTDGYYAVPWFRGEGAETRLHLVTYKGIDRRPPDLVHLAYRWDEVK
jgi:hypothetical protein